MTTSVLSLTEFTSFHHWYWTNPASPYAVAGVVVQRRIPEGVLCMRSCTLRLIKPGSPVVLATATTEEEFAGLLDRVGLPLRLPDSSRTVLWERAQNDHAVWTARQARRSLEVGNGDDGLLSLHAV